MNTFLVSLVLLAAASVQAAGLRNLPDGWLLGARDSARIVGSENTAGDHGWWLSAGEARLHGLADLPMRFLETGWAGLPLMRSGSIHFAWQRTGRDLWREDRVGGVIRWGDTYRVGLRMVWWRLTIDGRLEDAIWSPSVELELGDGEPWRLQLFGHPTVRPPWYGNRGQSSLASLAWVKTGLGWAITVDRERTGRPRFSFQILQGVGTGIALGARVEPATGTLGPVVVWHKGRLQIRTAHTVHPEIGTTHRFLLGTGEVRAAGW